MQKYRNLSKLMSFLIASLLNFKKVNAMRSPHHMMLFPIAAFFVSLGLLVGCGNANGAEKKDLGDVEKVEPVVMFATHGNGIYALVPKKNEDGAVGFKWTWDNEGNPGSCRGLAMLPKPDGSQDLFAVIFGGGVARKRATEDTFKFIGPNEPGETGWAGYGAILGSRIVSDPLHGDVVCASMNYTNHNPKAVGERGVYCIYDADKDEVHLELLDDPPLDEQAPPGPIVLFPRRQKTDDERTTALLVTFGAQIWHYTWDDDSRKMVWSQDENRLPRKYLFTDAHIYRREDVEDRVTVFLTYSDAACILGGDLCEDGNIIYRDFTSWGEPVGEWRRLDGTDDETPYATVWWSTASTSRWGGSEQASSRQAIFFRGIMWTGAALGTPAGSRLLRVTPGVSPDFPYHVEELHVSEEYLIQAVGVGPDAKAPSNRLVYLQAQQPSARGPGRRMDEVFLVSKDYGDTFTEFARFEREDRYLGDSPLLLGPSFDPYGPADTRGLYLCGNPPLELVKDTDGAFQKVWLEGAYGGHPFGLTVTKDGTQVIGNLIFRRGNTGRWKHPTFTVTTHFVAVGAENVYFSEWPYSRAPRSLVDGGGLYSIPLAKIETATMDDWKKVWDTKNHQCWLNDKNNANPPPVVHYMAVDLQEHNLFAIIRNIGWYDPWLHDTDECGDGLWWAHRKQPSDPWRWSLVAKESKGELFDSVWVVNDATGKLQSVVVSLKGNVPGRETFPHPFYRLIPPYWKLTPIDIGLDAEKVDVKSYTGTGFAQSSAGSALIALTVTRGEGEEAQSFLRISSDGGRSFTPPAGMKRYDGELGPLAMYTYPDGTHRLFILAPGHGVLVQKDVDDTGSLELVVDGLGKLTSTGPGASEMTIMWPPPSQTGKNP